VDQFEIGLIREEDLPAAADFLATSEAASEAKANVSSRSKERIVQQLRWRLLDNPAYRADSVGHCLRSVTGTIVGLSLSIPYWFCLEGKRLRGLCGASFFVDAPARMQGFFLFRRFLKADGVDFLFASTCNASAGALWKKLGGQAVPNSDCRWTLILHAAPVAEELALRKNAGKVMVALSRMTGHLAAPLLVPRKKEPFVSLRPCRDWDRLASLAVQHRDPNVLTCERSAAYLAWRYERSPALERHEIYEFTGPDGSLGWLAVGRQPNSGIKKQLRNYAILDVVKPTNPANGDSLLNALVELYADRADCIEVPATMATHSSLGRPRLWKRPNSFAVAYVNGKGETGRSLAEVIDLYPADGDSTD
jgi:hypothetical protein